MTPVPLAVGPHGPTWDVDAVDAQVLSSEGWARCERPGWWRDPVSARDYPGWRALEVLARDLAPR